jgi:hypothetical protein
MPSISNAVRSSSIEYRAKNYAARLRYLRTHTNIPVPEVYDACATTENSIGTPYIQMQTVLGRNLLDRETGLVIRPIPNRARLKLFHNIASLMAQTYRCQFTAIGGLEMSPSSGQFTIVSSQKFNGSPFNLANDYYRCIAKNIETFLSRQASADPETKVHSIFLP